MVDAAVVALAREWAREHPAAALGLVLELLGSVHETTLEGSTLTDALFWSITWAGVAHAHVELGGML